jgi:predicted membrane metal-binding protein
VIRATVMALLGGVALWSGRHVAGIQIVALTLLGMMLVSPADLFHAGAQLSFLSVLTIGRTLAAWQARQRSMTPMAIGQSTRQSGRQAVVVAERWSALASGSDHAAGRLAVSIDTAGRLVLNIA